MKKLPFIILIFSIACSGGDLNNTTYESVTIKEVHLLPDVEGINLIWHEFDSPDKNLAARLNDSLSFGNIIHDDLDAIREECKLSMQDFGMPQGTVETNFHVNMNEGFMLDISYDHITLGAHHYYGGYQKHIDLRTGREIYLDDIIEPTSHNKILKICNEKLQKEFKNAVLKAKAEDGFDLAAETGEPEFTEYTLNYFTITPDAICFTYDMDLPHAIKYFEVDVDVCFDYASYSDIVKKESVLGEYIEKKSSFTKPQEIAGETYEFIEVNGLKDFNKKLESAKKGDVVVVSSDILVSEALEIEKNDITISGDQSVPVKIYTDDPEAMVLSLVNCNNLVLKNLKLRHIVGDVSCGSGVIVFDNCHNITIENCDISGCGAYGITIYNNCDSINIRNNRIYDCSYWGIEMHSPNSQITGNHFYRNGEGKDDHIVSEDIKQSVTIRDNKYSEWDMNILNKEIEELDMYTSPSMDEFENNMGRGSASSMYKDGELRYLHLNWSEIDQFEMTVYFARKMPQYVHWKVEYGDTDMPDYVENYVPDVFEYTVEYSGWNIKSIHVSSPGVQDSVITDMEAIDKMYMRIDDYLNKWKTILNQESTIEESFDYVPII